MKHCPKDLCKGNWSRVYIPIIFKRELYAFLSLHPSHRVSHTQPIKQCTSQGSNCHLSKMMKARGAKRPQAILRGQEGTLQNHFGKSRIPQGILDLTNTISAATFRD